MQSAPRERELKFDLDPADAGRIKRHLGRIAERNGRQRLVSVYYDTPDLRLHRAAVTLRVRRAGRRVVQTVKARGTEAGLFDRPEWQREIKGAAPDLAAAQGTPVAPLLNGNGANALRPVFQTRLRRTVYRVARGGANVDVALSQGEVDTGRESAPVCELALELADGNVAGLFAVAREVAELGALHPAAKTKPDRGYELLGNGADPVRTKVEIPLAPETSAAAAFRIVGRACMSQLVANEAATLAGNAEALHQMRVAIRRLRAAISVFKAIVADDAVERVKAELKWLGGALGPARDADVFIAEVLKPLGAVKSGDPGIAWMLRNFERRRAAACNDAKAAIRSPRYRKLVIDALEWIEAGAWAGKGEELQRLQREQPVARFAADELARRFRKLRKGGKKLRRLDEDGRHRLRIRGKKLRYAMEFFAEAFPGKKSVKRRKQALAAIRELQDALGALNDTATRAKLAADAALSHNGAADPAEARKHAFAAGLVLGNLEAHVPSQLAAARRAHAKLRKAKPFWE